MGNAIIVSALAGFSTLIGGWMATNRIFLNKSALSAILAFAASAMLTISIIEIIPLGYEMLGGDLMAGVWAALSFCLGIIGVILIDRYLPLKITPGAIAEAGQGKIRRKNQLAKSGMIIGIVLALHNFPEGIAVFAAGYQDISVGLILAVAVAIHNIPEGIAVSAPIYHATGSRKRALLWSGSSGAVEPIGALLAALLVLTVMPLQFFGLIYGLVSGMMVYTAITELIPAARENMSKPSYTVGGAFGGAVVMGLSLFFLTI